ncbi:MAG: hypothetical protein ACREH8_16440 [Opitutaceae bacterium]
MAQSGATKGRTTLEREEKTAARRDAYVAFKAGNSMAALAALSAATQKWSRGEAHELALGRQLSDISFSFRNEGNSALASNVATHALSRLANAEGRMAPKDAVRALTLAGGIYEHVEGDLGRAQQAYRRVLILDPNAVRAKVRLAHIAAVEAAASAKAAANPMLQQRRTERGRQ